MMQFLEPLCWSLACAALLLWGLMSWPVTIVRREPTRVHKPLSRLGGVALVGTFVIGVLLDTDLEMSRQLLGLLMGSGIVLVMGVWDDMVPVPWWGQFGLQVLLGVLLFVFGMRAWAISNPFGDPLPLHPETQVFPALLLGVLWVVLVMNAMNWADGVDGLLGSISVLAFLTLFLVSLQPVVNQPTVAILSVMVLGAVTVFLCFNLPPARIMAGTSGAYFIGFLIAALSLFAGAKIATALVVLVLPVCDAVSVFCERIVARVSPFVGGDARHTHDRLRVLGWSDRKIVAWYTGVSLLSALVALLGNAVEKLVFVSLTALLFLGGTMWIRRQVLFQKTPVI